MIPFPPAVVAAMAKKPSARWRREHPEHHADDIRTPQWNAWRERAALHPTEKAGPARKPVRRREPTAAEQRARRLSSRGSRRRAARRGE